METINELLAFIKKSPTPYHAVSQVKGILNEEGFSELAENEAWCVVPGGKYYVSRNGSSLIAFSVGYDLRQYTFNITASHTDSPAFKIKENAGVDVKGKYCQLNTEGYGGMLCGPWLDRPLSVAGRVVATGENGLETHLVNVDRDLLLIPSLAIHMNREANNGQAYNKQIDMLPLYGGPGVKGEDLKAQISEAAGILPENIYGSDLFVYNRQEPAIWGASMEYYSAPRIDDLSCVFTTLKGFLQSRQEKNINVLACFDNEEVGSLTKQGADSTFLADTLRRVNEALGKKENDLAMARAGSFMLSCDNAHAVHPNHPEKSDGGNGVYMNEGIVIKSHAGQKYTSDGISMAIFKRICEKAQVPVQYFSNRSDMNGGSTLGNIAMAHFSVNTVDIGLPQLAMHSPYETAGVKDVDHMIRAVKAFYETHLTVKKDAIILED